MISKIWKLLAWRNGGFIRYNSIWQNSAALFFIVFAGQQFSLQFIGQVVIFILFSTAMTGFGYLVNDLADIDLDRRHGKPNVFTNMSSRWASLVALLTLMIGSIFGLPFARQPSFAILWLLWVLVATSYSLPPLRLKERGLAGLVATVLAQQTLPTALLFAAFGQLTTLGALVFLLYSTARGLSSDTSHQIRDWPRDAGTGTRTFAVQYGRATAQSLYAASLEVERLVLGGVVVLLVAYLPAVTLLPLGWEIGLAWPLAIFYFPLLLRFAGSSLAAFRQGRLEETDPYAENRQASVRDGLHVIHHSFPSVIVPLYCAVWATWFYWPNIIFVLALVLLYRVYSPRRWAGTWPLSLLISRTRT